MKLIKDLGSVTKESTRRNGTKYLRYVHMAEFECPNCHKIVTRDIQSGTKAEVCTDCKGLHTKTHGMSKSKPYKVWCAMLQRCNNPKNKKYYLYGGKGIKVCDKWQTWEGFWEDNKDRYGVGTSIDRIDPDKGYSLENTRWVPIAINSARVQHKVKAVKRYPLIQIGINTYKIADTPDMIYDSIVAAEQDMGDKHSHISDVTLGRRKSAFGYYWEAESMVVEKPLFLNSKEQRKIDQYVLVQKSLDKMPEEVFIKTWNSAYEAAQATPGAHNNLITAVCKGRRKSHAGYIWKYHEE